MIGVADREPASKTRAQVQALSAKVHERGVPQDELDWMATRHRVHSLDVLGCQEVESLVEAVGHHLDPSGIARTEASIEKLVDDRLQHLARESVAPAAGLPRLGHLQVVRPFLGLEPLFLRNALKDVIEPDAPGVVKRRKGREFYADVWLVAPI
jgi:hypothetical protein